MTKGVSVAVILGAFGAVVSGDESHDSGGEYEVNHRRTPPGESDDARGTCRWVGEPQDPHGENRTRWKQKKRLGHPPERNAWIAFDAETPVPGRDIPQSGRYLGEVIPEREPSIADFEHHESDQSIHVRDEAKCECDICSRPQRPEHFVSRGSRKRHVDGSIHEPPQDSIHGDDIGDLDVREVCRASLKSSRIHSASFSKSSRSSCSMVTVPRMLSEKPSETRHS